MSFRNVIAGKLQKSRRCGRGGCRFRAASPRAWDVRARAEVIVLGQTVAAEMNLVHAALDDRLILAAAIARSPPTLLSGCGGVASVRRSQCPRRNEAFASRRKPFGRACFVSTWGKPCGGQRRKRHVFQGSLLGNSRRPHGRGQGFGRSVSGHRNSPTDQSPNGRRWRPARRLVEVEEIRKRRPPVS